MLTEVRLPYRSLELPLISTPVEVVRSAARTMKENAVRTSAMLRKSFSPVESGRPKRGGPRRRASAYSAGPATSRDDADDEPRQGIEPAARERILARAEGDRPVGTGDVVPVGRGDGETQRAGSGEAAEDLRPHPGRPADEPAIAANGSMRNPIDAPLRRAKASRPPPTAHAQNQRQPVGRIPRQS